MSSERPGTIVQRGRAKAYRPLPAERRREILADGLAAYDRGDFFLAHELLEPAWMGASDPAERDLYQGLIKLAAAYVHAARGNLAGVLKNLRGARDRLADAEAEANAAGADPEVEANAAGADAEVEADAAGPDAEVEADGRADAAGAIDIGQVDVRHLLADIDDALAGLNRGRMPASIRIRRPGSGRDPAATN